MKTSQQGEHYGADYDYEAESPHLKHDELNRKLIGRIAGLLEGLDTNGNPPEVLEIGAGDGSVTGRLLDLGCDVTGTEMSRDSVESMTRRFAGNDRFRAVHDADGSLEALGDGRFDMILFASVLHHIPDYLAAIRNATGTHLRPGGALVSIQDPLWYDRMSGLSLGFTRASYLSWRVTQGNVLRGLKTRIRRARHGLSEEAAGDAIEYHVVRDGVDEIAIRDQLNPDFDRVEIFRYWSSQGTPQQRAGERLGLENTFAMFASGHRGASEEPAEGGPA